MTITRRMLPLALIGCLSLAGCATNLPPFQIPAPPSDKAHVYLIQYDSSMVLGLNTLGLNYILDGMAIVTVTETKSEKAHVFKNKMGGSVYGLVEVDPGKIEVSYDPLGRSPRFKLFDAEPGKSYFVTWAPGPSLNSRPSLVSEYNAARLLSGREQVTETEE